MTAQTALQNIPEELRSYPQWVCHDAAKRPINPHTGQLADVTDPTTWGSFEQARAIAEAGKCAGIGFVFTQSDPYTGIDLDVPEGAAPSAGQQRIYDAFNTYAEQSPSGRGLHIIAKGRVADGGVRNSALGVEVYSSGRFFTFTGNVVRREPIAECQPLVDALCDEIRPNRDAGASEIPDPCPAPQISDEALRERVCESDANREYYQGDVSDWSAAYFALICAVCLFSSDEAQVRRVVMASPLVQNAPRNGKQLTIDIDLAQRWAKEFSDHSQQECDHERQELRHGTNKGGHPVTRMQCLDCGLRVGNALKAPPNADELPGFDDAMHDAYLDTRKAAKETIDLKYIEIQLRRWKAKEKGDSYYSQAHNAYLASPEWRDRRQRVMERANGLCEGCRLAPAKEVHHLSYDHWGHEFLFELVALCGDCHDRIHAKGDHEALVAGCSGCLHASRGHYCRLYDVPMVTALEADELCTLDRDGFEPAN